MQEKMELDKKVKNSMLDPSILQNLQVKNHLAFDLAKKVARDKSSRDPLPNMKLKLGVGSTVRAVSQMQN